MDVMEMEELMVMVEMIHIIAVMEQAEVVASTLTVVVILHGVRKMVIVS